MASAGVVSFELIINVRRGLEFFFQVVGSHQGSGTIHRIEILDIRGNFKIGGVVIQLLANKLFAKHGFQFFRSHGLLCPRIEEGSRLVFHICPEIVPGLGYLVFSEVDFVGDGVFHVCLLLSIMVVRGK